MKLGRNIVGVLLALVGLVWIGQGTGIIQGSSFMTGQAQWALIGLVCLVIGGLLLFTTNRPQVRG